MMIVIAIALEAVHARLASFLPAFSGANSQCARSVDRRLPSHGAQAHGSGSCSEHQLVRWTPTQFAAGQQKPPAFNVEKPEADEDNESIAYDFDQMDGQSNRLGCCAKQHGCDCDNDDGNDRLDAGRHEGQQVSSFATR